MSEIVKSPASDKEPQTAVIEQMTPEQLELNRKRFLFRQGMLEEDPDAGANVEAEKKVEPKEEAKTPPDDKKEEPKEDKKEEKVEAKSKPSLRAKPANVVPMTPETVSAAAEAGARAGAQAVIESNRAESKNVDPELELDSEDNETLDAIRHLEASKALAAGTADRTIEFWKKEAAYMDAWNKANPGKEFNPNDEENQAWYSKHEPVVNEKALAKAKRDLLQMETARIAKEEARKEFQPEIEKMKFERNLEKRLPEIDQAADQAVIDLVIAASPELGKLLEKNGKKVLDSETQEKIEAEDSVAYQIISEESEELRVLSTQLDLLTSFPQHYQFNPNMKVQLDSGRKIYPHRELVEYIATLETNIAKLPKDESERDGKAFIPQPAMIDRETAIQNSKTMSPEQKKAAFRDLHARTWTVTPDDIRRGLIADIGEKAASRIAKSNAAHEKRIAGKKKAEGETTPKGEEGKSGEAQSKPLRKTPPSVTDASDKTDIQLGGKNNLRTQSQIIDEKAFGIT